jgi:hypothetical protein
MNTQRKHAFIVLTLMLALLAGACGQAQSTQTPIASATSQPVASPTPAPTQPPTEAPTAPEFGFINGRVHGQAPPTPPMVVYAVEATSGAWFFTETQQADGEAPFTLQVAPGSYQVFAFSDVGPFAGYTLDGWTLATVAVAAGQTVPEIVAGPPGQSECGATFGLPASPDGRFAAIAGPDAACREAVLAGTPGGLGPLSADACSDLANGMAEALAVQVATTEVMIEMSWSEQQGSGCQMTAVGDGSNFDSIFTAQDGVKGVLAARGWVEEMQAPMCLGTGGWGPGATSACFTQADGICEAFVYVELLDPELCSGDEPIGACLDRLPPEQLIYQVSLTCAQGYRPMDAALPKTEPARIQFTAGTTSAQVTGRLDPGGLHPYMLNAAAGQEMTVNLATAGGAILSIWGADGTVLISDHADASTWTGVLPLTQDYYIDVIDGRSGAQSPIDYTLEVIIPPTPGPGHAAGPEPLPVDVPVGFETLFGLGEPLMLPAEFPVGEGLPAVHPYVITAEPGEYEVSLDFGPDCRGAGACHYGSLAGKRVDSDVPVGTRTFPFDVEQAQPVTLARGIQGYFVEAVCMANCNDAQVFWLYNGYQYVLGLKGGAQADAVGLANAAIENSITPTPR